MFEFADLGKLEKIIELHVRCRFKRKVREILFDPPRLAMSQTRRYCGGMTRLCR